MTQKGDTKRLPSVSITPKLMIYRDTAYLKHVRFCVAIRRLRLYTQEMKTVSLLSSRHNSLYIGGSGNILGLEIRLLYIDQPSAVFTVHLDTPLLV